MSCLKSSFALLSARHDDHTIFVANGLIFSVASTLQTTHASVPKYVCFTALVAHYKVDFSEIEMAEELDQVRRVKGGGELRGEGG